MALVHRSSRWHLVQLTAAAIVTTACFPGPPRTSFNEAMRRVIEADTLADVRVTATPAGWEVGLLPQHADAGAAECPAPQEVWPLQHLYRSQPALGAELFVLALPWLSPAEVDAVRAGAWRGDGGPVGVAEIQVHGEEAAGATQDLRRAWRVGGPAAPRTVELALRPWPGGRGTYVVGACAPSARWEAVRPALLQVAGALEPLERSGPEVAVERANALRDAARAWRFTLPAEQVGPRVAAGRREALAALRAVPGFEASAPALVAAAGVEALDTQGVEAGPGYDAPAVVALLTRASQLDPAHFHADELLGRALLDAGDPVHAREALERGVAGLYRPQATLLLTLGDARRATGDRPGAEEAWRRARSTLDQDRKLPWRTDGPLAADVRRRQGDLETRLLERLGPAGGGASGAP